MLDGTKASAPRLLGHGRIRAAGWFIVSTSVRGHPAARPDDPNWLDSLAATLGAIHDVSRHSAGGLALVPGPARTSIDDGPPPELGRIAQTLWPALERRRDELALGRTVLVHGDFHAGNVHWVGRRVAGVIDWEMARWGPAAADVAYCYMDLALAAGRRTARQFLAAYLNRAGNAPGFDAWLLLATLRPLPDPARWLPSYEGAGRRDLTPTLLRRRLALLAGSLA
jgi:aminoglycoside phosphotransferase (APT) family kinase protein